MPHATTEPDSVQSDGLANLLTADSRQLLDLINRLRNLGVNKWVQLPTIIVVGDQNSGKSSVLEAISKLKFPSADGLCTTFATRLTLHREPKKTPSVRIEPSHSHSSQIQAQLRAFSPPDGEDVDIESVISQAKKHLVNTVGKKDDSFLEDELLIETSNPDFPPVTLVDLPGIIHTANENQQDEDVTIVKKMVETYMKEEKSIILAVVSAQYGVANQEILGLAKKLDPQGKRTLGIITKPDILREGSEPQELFLKTAANEVSKYHLDLGWHVVRNLDEETRKSGADRDLEETKWFDEHSVWADRVGVQNIGIENLRDRLAALLEKHTRESLPEVVNAIQDRLDTCSADLSKMGDARESPDQQRRYLTSVSEQFKRLVELANDGIYHRDSFFASSEGDSRRLRASVQNLNRQFGSVMRSYGHNMELSLSATSTYNLAPVHLRNVLRPPEIKGRKQCLAKVEQLEKSTTGKELDGASNAEIVRELFQLKSKQWQRIAEAHVDEVWNLVRSVLCSMIHHVADDLTAQRIIRNIITENLDRKKANIAAKLHDVLAPHLRCHPITYNPLLLIKKQLLNKEAEGDSSANLSTLHEVEAYYQISLDTFVDNVNILVVEMSLVDGLPDIFPPTAVSRMSDLELDGLASEPSTIKKQRRQLKEKEALLDEARRECKKHAAGLLSARGGHPSSCSFSDSRLDYSNTEQIIGATANEASRSGLSFESLASSPSSTASRASRSSSSSSGTQLTASSSISSRPVTPVKQTPFMVAVGSGKDGFSFRSAPGTVARVEGKTGSTSASAASSPSPPSGKSYPLSYNCEKSWTSPEQEEYQAITSDFQFKGLSFEELRMAETELLQQPRDHGRMLDPDQVLEIAKRLTELNLGD